MKMSLITTVKNEENSIRAFLVSILQQPRFPDEFIIVDGGSTDRTVEIYKNMLHYLKGKTLSTKL